MKLVGVFVVSVVVVEGEVTELALDWSNLVTILPSVG
jgi:hypothetical protein